MEFLEKLEAVARWVDAENRKGSSDNLFRALSALDDLTLSKNILAMAETLRVAEKVAQGTSSVAELKSAFDRLKIATASEAGPILGGRRPLH